MITSIFDKMILNVDTGLQEFSAKNFFFAFEEIYTSVQNAYINYS